jgi:hypothetical protein
MTINQEDTLLIDAPLIPDPDADQELGPKGITAIADEDLKGSRLLVVRRAVEPIDLEGTPGGVIQIACSFQPAQGTRFISAQFRLRLTMPEGIRIIDLAPRSVEDTHPVEFTLEGKGKLGIKSLPLPIEPSLEIGANKKYAIYHCKVQGTGEGTSLARWDFKENPDLRNGIGQEQILNLTLPVTGQVTGSAIVSARIARSGIQGKLEAIRDMILGTPPQERFYPITLNIPTIPPANGLTKFFNLL